MKIAVFSTDVGRGGATIAMIRLIEGLVDRGHEVCLFCLTGESLICPVVQLDISKEILRDTEVIDFFSEELQSKQINQNRTYLSNTLFSTNLVGYDVSKGTELYEFDV